MGATGRGINKLSRSGNVNNETFGIKGATNYKGALPKDTNLDKPGSGKVTLRVDTRDKLDIIFQFKLSKDGKYMTITAHDPNSPPVKAKVAVDAGLPSLDKVMASGTGAQRSQAMKIKHLMSKSSEISEDQLGSIARKLIKNKKSR